MTEQQFRDALRAEVADLTASPALLEGIAIKRRRRIVRNRAFAATAAALVVIGGVPLALDGGGEKPAPPAATATAAVVPSPAADIHVGSEATYDGKDADLLWESKDEQIPVADAPFGVDYPAEPGTYFLAATCDAERSDYKIVLELRAPGAKPVVKTIRPNKGIAFEITALKRGVVSAVARPVGEGRAAITWRLYRDK
ncbi:hypothetical protein GCM10027589_03410 [Actinocorallia lasiicapitis]